MKGKARGLIGQAPKVAVTDTNSAKEKERQRKRTGARRREESRAAARQRASDDSRKVCSRCQCCSPSGGYAYLRLTRLGVKWLLLLCLSSLEARW